MALAAAAPAANAYNQPSSWLDKAPPGGIEWSRLTAVVQKDPPQIDDELAKMISILLLQLADLLGYSYVADRAIGTQILRLEHVRKIWPER